MSSNEYDAQSEVITQAQFDELVSDLTPLPNLPLPPKLLLALNYRHHDTPASEHRFVSLYWMSNKPRIDDGSLITDGDKEVYLLFIRHGAVSEQLNSYQLGSADIQNQHRLLLDRAENKWYIGDEDLVSALVRFQYLIGMPKAEFERQRAEAEARFNANAEFDLSEEIDKPFQLVESRTFTLAEFQAIQYRQDELFYTVRNWLRDNYSETPPKAVDIYNGLNQKRQARKPQDDGNEAATEEQEQ